MDPAAGDDLGPHDDGAGLDVDAEEHDDHALVGEHPAVAQHAGADIADDAVDVEEAGGHLRVGLRPLLSEHELVAVGAHDDVVGGDAHLPAELGVGDHVAVLAVHRDEPLGPGDREVHLEVLGLGVAGGVDVGDARVHDLRAGPDQAVDDLGDVLLVARDRVRAHDHDVVGAEGEPAVLVGRHEGQGRHGLALGAGGDDAHLLRREVADVGDVAEAGLGDVQQAHLPGQAHVLLHRHAHGGHDAVEGDGGIGDLLDPVDVAGEAGGDDPPALVAVEEVVEHATDGGLRGRVAVLVGVGRVRQQEADALVAGERADAGEVGETAVDRREVELEVTGVEDHALGGVEGGGHAVRHRVGDGDELHVEGPIIRRSPSVTGMNSVRSSRPASSMRLRARPRVSAVP